MAINTEEYVTTHFNFSHLAKKFEKLVRAVLLYFVELAIPDEHCATRIQ